MIAVFILTSLGVALTVFLLMYKQVFGGIVKTRSIFLKHILVITLLYVAMMLLGYGLATRLLPILPFGGYMISSILFVILGFKMYSGIRKGRKLNWTFDTSAMKVLLLFSLSNSFDAFFIGIAAGLYAEFQWIHLLIYALIIAFFIIMANVMARRKSATLAVWMVGSLGAALLIINAIVMVMLSWIK